nr:DUF5317 domain-containing protein [Neobacillus sp. Marseille-Q6967]
MVFDGIIFSFIVGFFRKGNLKGLAQLKLKYGWVFPLLLGIQIFYFLYQNNSKLLAQSSNYLYIVVYIVGLLFLYLNRENPGFNLILIGVFLNFLVMVMNGGRMPVSPEAASVLDPKYLEALKTSLYAKHQVLNESTRFGFLADIIPLSKPYPKTQIISIGDVIMNVGAFIFIQHLMLENRRSTNTRDTSSSMEGGETV